MMFISIWSDHVGSHCIVAWPFQIVSEDGIYIVPDLIRTSCSPPLALLSRGQTPFCTEGMGSVEWQACSLSNLTVQLSVTCYLKSHFNFKWSVNLKSATYDYIPPYLSLHHTPTTSLVLSPLSPSLALSLHHTPTPSVLKLQTASCLYWLLVLTHDSNIIILAKFMPS